MELVARAGTRLDETEALQQVLEVLETGGSLILSWDDAEHVWMNVGPSGDAITNEYLVDTLRPALHAVEQGCFDLWRTSPLPALDVEALLSDDAIAV